jgi:integrase
VRGRATGLPEPDGGCGAGFRRSTWLPLLERAGFRYRKPHTLRHTYLSLLIQAGEPIPYVQQQLGHHSGPSPWRYVHFVPRGDRRAVDALDDTTGRNLYPTGPHPAEATSSR